MAPIVIPMANRIYVPEEYVRNKHTEAYTYYIGTDEQIAEGNAEVVRTYRTYDNGVVGFPRGDIGKVNSTFSDFEIDDQRKLVPHGYKELEFTGELRPDQQRVWSEWIAKGYGLVEAPARWGKTVLCSYAVTKLRQRTLVLAQEETLLEQFLEEFRLFTNINDIEFNEKKRLIGFARRVDEVFPVLTCATWQMYEKHYKQFHELRDSWGLVIIDEAHSAAAKCFSRIVNGINSYWRLPVTATPERKDQMEFVVFDIAGPVVTRGLVESLPCDVLEVETGTEVASLKNGIGRLSWNKMRKELAGNEDRNRLIVSNVVKDAKAGHKVVITTDLIEHVHKLKKLINEASPETTVEIVIGSVKGDDRKDVRERAKAGEIDVVIAFSRIIQLGWNVPAWSSIHVVMPTSNKHNYYQRISRVRTPCANCPGVDKPNCLSRSICLKQPPRIYLYVDDNRILRNVARTAQGVHENLGFTASRIGNIARKRNATIPGKKNLSESDKKWLLL